MIILPLWLKIIFCIGALLGLFLLIKSISKMLALYNNPNSVEFFALLPLIVIEIKQADTYEIAVKRSSLFGIIPTAVTFGLLD